MNDQIKKDNYNLRDIKWHTTFQATVIGIFFITIFQYRSACLDALRQDKLNKRNSRG